MPPKRTAATNSGLVPTERGLGQSESNFSVDNAAGELALIFRKHEGLSASITEAEMEGDSVRTYFLRYCRFLSSRVIPKYFDENLQTNNPENNGKLTTGTLSLYIGNHLKQVKRLLPSHDHWKSNQNPDWWSGMRKNFETECERFQKTYSGDAVFGTPEIHAVYRCIKDPTLPLRQTHLQDYVSAVDLKYMLRKLASEATIEGNGKCLDRVLVGMTHNCIGRGGEIKFQNYNDWIWDPLLNCLDCQWHEPKNIETHPMPLVCDSEYWETDIYHQLGSFFSVENGLFRNTEHVTNGLENSVFPDLHSYADGYVTRKISTIMKKSLPAGFPGTVAAGYSARSLRKGAVTGLSMHREMSTLRVAARSGHSTGTTVDSYLDKSNPARCIHAANAAAGWKHVENIVSPYRLEAIGNVVESNKLMRTLFACSIPALNVSGKLHIVLKTCAAALIMYHPKVSRDIGPSNAISSKIHEAAREAKITDDRFPNMSPESVLNEWAKLVARDFKMQNTETAPVGADAASIAGSVEILLSVNRKMAADLADIKASHECLTLENATGKARISMLEDQQSSLVGELRNANLKLSVLRTPEKAPAHRSDRNQSPQAAALGWEIRQ